MGRFTILGYDGICNFTQSAEVQSLASKLVVYRSARTNRFVKWAGASPMDLLVKVLQNLVTKLQLISDAAILRQFRLPRLLWRIGVG